MNEAAERVRCQPLAEFKVPLRPSEQALLGHDEQCKPESLGFQRGTDS